MRDIASGSASANVTGLTADGTHLCFVATNATGRRGLWSSDGTAASTHGLPVRMPNVHDHGYGPVIGGRHFFVTHQAGHFPKIGGWSQLWRSDCAGSVSRVSPRVAATYRALTPAGRRVYAYAENNASPHRRYFAAYTGRTFDGFIWGPGQRPRTATVGSRLYILNGSHQLLKVDTGANAGAVAPNKLDKVYDLPPGPVSSVVGDRLVVLNDYRETDHSIYGVQFWGTDGTGPGTQMLYQTDSYGDGSSYYVSWLGSTATRGFFTTDIPGTNGPRLWATDGTSAGTVTIANTAVSQPLGIIGSRLVFTVYDQSTSAQQLWVSDGTSSGTVFVTTLPSAVIRSVTVVGGTLLMAIDNPGVPTTDNLWTSDGTAAGTREVSSQTFMPMWLGDATVVQPGVIAFVADDGVHGNELWRTDLTQAGTRLVADLYPGSQSSNPGCDYGDDGCPYPNPQHLVVISSTLYFSADSPDTGRELWAWTP